MCVESVRCRPPADSRLRSRASANTASSRTCTAPPSTIAKRSPERTAREAGWRVEAELAQHGAVEARVGQGQRQGVFRSVRPLTVLAAWRSSKPSANWNRVASASRQGALRRAAAYGEQASKPGVVEHLTQLVAQARVAAALGKRRAGDTHGFLRNFGAKGLDADLGQDTVTSPQTSASPPGSSAKPRQSIRQWYQTRGNPAAGRQESTLRA